MRSPRKQEPNARYHVVARANRREFIFAEQWVKELFENTIVRAKRKYYFRIDDFTIMGNHFHMVIQPAINEDLSRIMQWILSQFARSFNRKLGITGHVWGGRFFSSIIHSVQELIHTFEYIDNNPVKAGLVTFDFDWKFGGLHHARSGKFGVQDRLLSWMLLLFPRHQPLQLT